VAESQGPEPAGINVFTNQRFLGQAMIPSCFQKGFILNATWYEAADDKTKF
jgi:hypothetical protein